MNSPLFMSLWLYVLSAIPIGTASIKNKGSAAKFIAVFQHGIEVLTLAVAQLQAVVDTPEPAKVAKLTSVSTAEVVANSKQERAFVETVRQLVA